MIENKSICIVVPVYNVGNKIVDFISSIPDYVDKIIVIDDKCPLKSGLILKKNIPENKKLNILFNENNLGVGGTVKRGYNEALKSNEDIIIKIDGDGQMDPDQIPILTKSIINGYDYSKGNRFLNNTYIKNYPLERFYGNKFLSLFSKLSTGYWDIFDPINGFTAIKREKLNNINLDDIDNGYFFETDMLFNLYLLKSKIKDVPVKIKYFKNHRQNLSVFRESFNFFFKNLYRLLKRIKISYLSNNFGLPGLLFSIGSISLMFTLFYGGFNWLYYSFIKETFAPNGVITFSAISLIVGLFSMFMFMIIDNNNNPNLKK